MGIFDNRSYSTSPWHYGVFYSIYTTSWYCCRSQPKNPGIIGNTPCVHSLKGGGSDHAIQSMPAEA